MEKINFINNSLPAINATNLNQLQDNFENAIDSTSCDMYKQNAGNVTNTYGLIAEYNISALYDDFSDTIILNRSMGNYDGNLSSVIVNVVGRFDNGNLLNCSVNYLTREMEEVKVIALTNIINDVANIKLYARVIGTHENVYGKSLDYKSTGNTTRQYYKNQPNITDLPSGTQIYGKTPRQTGEITSYSSSFGQIDINSYTKVGNTVQIIFRGYLNSDINDNTKIIDVPFNAIQHMTTMFGAGGEYEISSPKWAYLTQDNNSLRGNQLNAGQWIHISFVYLCED